MTTTAGVATSKPMAAMHVSRFVIVRDQDGRRHALRLQAIIALVESESGGTVVLLNGGRIVIIPDDLDAALLRLT